MEITYLCSSQGLGWFFEVKLEVMEFHVSLVLTTYSIWNNIVTYNENFVGLKEWWMFPQSILTRGFADIAQTEIGEHISHS